MEVNVKMFVQIPEKCWCPVVQFDAIYIHDVWLACALVDTSNVLSLGLIGLQWYCLHPTHCYDSKEGAQEFLDDFMFNNKPIRRRVYHPRHVELSNIKGTFIEEFVKKDNGEVAAKFEAEHGIKYNKEYLQCVEINFDCDVCALKEGCEKREEFIKGGRKKW